MSIYNLLNTKRCYSCRPTICIYTINICRLVSDTFNKKLSYRRGTARHAMLVGSCCFTRYGT